MSAPKGNQFWRNADPDKIGRPRKFDSPKELWEKCTEYFTQCDENPITATESSVSEKGMSVKTTEHRIPYTWEGLYVFLEVSHLDDYKKRDEFSGIITHVKNIIRNQKFAGAAAGVFNANIIARDLGLMERQDITTDGEKLPANNYELPQEAIDRAIEKL